MAAVSNDDIKQLGFGLGHGACILSGGGGRGIGAVVAVKRLMWSIIH